MAQQMRVGDRPIEESRRSIRVLPTAPRQWLNHQLPGLPGLPEPLLKKLHIQALEQRLPP